VILPLFYKARKESCGKSIWFIRTKIKILSSLLTCSLVFGAFFPAFYDANAGFFSSLVGDKVLADVTVANTAQTVKNSQNMDLLQAAMSPTLALADKKEKKAGTNDTGSEIDDSANVNIVSDNALLPAAGPLTVSGGTDYSEIAEQPISVYVVRKGDAISQIAEMFGVSVNTILWANDMKKGDKLVEGDVLFILPVTGLEHTVTKGQTLKGIAKLYKADVGDIASYNGLTADAALAVGDKLIIPNAEKSEESDKPVKSLSASIAKSTQYYQAHPTKNLGSYFINPVPGYRLSQGIHDHNAVDLAIATGTPIRAAASGRVTLARMGWNGAFGNLVIISHPNGVETLYAHQSKILVTTGQTVEQGQIIGYVGCTGRCTGPHLHFEVHGAQNPGATGKWAY
jgi:LysM repeat protein